MYIYIYMHVNKQMQRCIHIYIYIYTYTQTTLLPSQSFCAHPRLSSRRWFQATSVDDGSDDQESM